ncbi:putative ribonuclease H-like domain-containing protein [Tanacetum coccineum]
MFSSQIKNVLSISKVSSLLMKIWLIFRALERMMSQPGSKRTYSFMVEITCLVAKANRGEAVLWHRRLGIVNFHNIHKLVKGIWLGFTFKDIQLDHSCVEVRKGNRRASCKKIEERTVREPLELLHMDLFGPVSVESINKKKYCLVVTDDCSKFKFKNQLMNEFCAKKGIKREYSIARTPQQNGVAERKNRTLIEAARTMLADSLLHFNLWAVNLKQSILLLYQKGKGPDWMFDLDLLTPSMNYIPVRKENYADSKEQGISCDDVEDMDDQQFIVHTTQSMPPEERTAAKEVTLSSEDQALHDELVGLMHLESLAKDIMMIKGLLLKRKKRRISIAKG